MLMVGTDWGGGGEQIYSKENVEALFLAGQETGLEVKRENTKHSPRLISREQKAE